MKRSTSTTTRTNLPAATSRSPERARQEKTSRRPSIRSSAASASTTAPSATGERWSIWTWRATVVLSSPTDALIASWAACSKSATILQVASTGTLPEPSAGARSVPPTRSETWPWHPGTASVTSPRYGPAPAAENLRLARLGAGGEALRPPGPQALAGFAASLEEVLVEPEVADAAGVLSEGVVDPVPFTARLELDCDRLSLR